MIHNLIDWKKVRHSSSSQSGDIWIMNKIMNIHITHDWLEIELGDPGKTPHNLTIPDRLRSNLTFYYVSELRYAENAYIITHNLCIISYFDLKYSLSTVDS